MSDSFTSGPSGEEWLEYTARLNEQLVSGFERNVEAQGDLIEAWAESLEDGFTPTDPGEAIESYAEAYRIWLETAEEQFDDTLDGMETGELEPAVIRDRWLSAANESFKEVMGTTAFAEMTGRSIEDALATQQEADSVSQESLAALGFATRSDIMEIGERLVELERRQHELTNELRELLVEIKDD